MLYRRRDFLLFSAFAGCTPKPQRSAPRPRVISLSPGTTEALFAIGAGSLLVGRSRFCNFPVAAKKIPSVGGFVDPSLETILSLDPSLIVGAQSPGGRDLVHRLSRRGIDTYFPETDTFKEIEAMIVGLGKRLNKQRKATSVKKNLEQAKQQVARAVQHHQRPKVLFLFGLRPIVAAGRGGFPDEMLRLAGGQNVVRGHRFPTLGIETVLALDPDIILDATGMSGAESGLNKKAAGWRETRAVRSGKLIPLRDDRVLRPGPRVGEGLRLLARAINPKIVLR